MDLLKESEKLFESIRELAEKQIDRGSSRAHIHHVPKDLREGNELQYEPRIISIGPLHFTSTRLTQGKEIKHAFFHDFCSRCFGKQMTELKPIIQGLKEMEIYVRSFYGDIHDDRKMSSNEFMKMSSNEFVKMMLIDGCFILELLWRQQDYMHKKDDLTYKKKKDDLVFHSSGMVKIVVRDLFLFENQLPYFLIDFLFVEVRNCYALPTLYDYLKSLVGMVTGSTVPSLPDNDRANTKHLLEFAWHFVRYPCNGGDTGVKENSPEKALRCAKSVLELKQYGMKLHRNEDMSGHFLPAKIRNGKLEMGVIELDEWKSSLFWNLLAFEQLADTKRVYLFQSFILFMNSLIKVEDDVNLLCSRDIIINGMKDSSQVVKLFNRLAQKVNRQDITSFYYHDFFMAMDAYCKSCIPRSRAYLMHNYYDARWDVLNALLLFILTFTQTFFSIISYRK